LPPDQIVAQSPSPNAQGVVSPKVNLLYNAPASAEKIFVMPDFVGAKLADATVAVTDAGMKLGSVRTVNVPDAQTAATPATPTAVQPKAVPKSKPIPMEAFIVAQTPAAGSKVTTGATVGFDILRK
jgi:beta-lactam-binding protein with PASTA domain